MNVFQGDDTQFVISIARYVQKQEVLYSKIQKFLKLRGKFPKLKKKTQNSRKKLKLWEDFAPPERPSGVIKKAWSRGKFKNIVYKTILEIRLVVGTII